MHKLERRAFEFEFRAEGESPKIVGHAALFDVEADIGGYYRERIAPGAFADSIAKDDVRALWNHDPNHILGRNKAGTLKLSEDAQGLLSEITPPDTQFARDLMASIKRGDVSQMSFGFFVLDDEWKRAEDKNKPPLRILKRVQLFDVSPVAFPAYEQTDVAVRSAVEILATLPKDIEIPAKPLLHDLLRRRQMLVATF